MLDFICQAKSLNLTQWRNVENKTCQLEIGRFPKYYLSIFKIPTRRT